MQIIIKIAPGQIKSEYKCNIQNNCKNMKNIPQFAQNVGDYDFKRIGVTLLYEQKCSLGKKNRPVQFMKIMEYVTLIMNEIWGVYHFLFDLHAFGQIPALKI